MSQPKNPIDLLTRDYDPKRYVSSNRTCDDPHLNFQRIRNRDLQWAKEAKQQNKLENKP